MFTISIGNIPASATTVHIKITYVMELTVRDNDILLSIPYNTVCGTTSNLTQMTTRSEMASEGSTKFGFKANITMPFKILAIKSNSYPLNIKVLLRRVF